MLPTLDLAMELIDNQYTSGSNSVVEFLPSKQAVAGSNPVSRSSIPNLHLERFVLESIRSFEKLRKFKILT